ncbi:MAG: hypothetical protein NC241_03240 [Bacteroides sp.]|nr:hypothetical protein [Bacteroides sp.]MCM1456993.1 hypothetical protein [Lachnoclostridium sp.]
MKRVLIVCALAATLLTSCENEKQRKEVENAQAIAEATREELESAIAERDQLLDLINEVSSGMDDIKGVEEIVAVNASGESVDNRGKITSDINAIRASLEERRQKLADLEQKLKNSKINNSKLLQTIETLRSQIDSQQREIETLTASLSEARKRIGVLDQAVDSLGTQVAEVTEQRDAAQEEAVAQANLANACYYAIGSKSELKAHDIIEGGGFLRKTKIMQGDFDQSFFIKADRRTLATIPLHSKKAKIISTTPPASSYAIKDVNGQKVLEITNPNLFWGVSNYLVIQID